MNLNKDTESEYKLACELFKTKLSHDEMVKMLKTGNVPQKQYAALCLDTITNKEEGAILINNLTGCDGKIRESAALKINQLLNSNPELSQFLNYPKIFADASIDINANICRLVIDSTAILKKNNEFSDIYLECILNFIWETFDEIDKFIFKDKKYIINKQLFKLYWCLESLKLFVYKIEPDILLKILERTSNEKEYTIREKTAQILKYTNNKIFQKLIEKLKNDENYYVKIAMIK